MKEGITDRRFTPAPTADSNAIPKDEATQKLIAHMAEENYNVRVQLQLQGDALGDWVAAEKRYLRTFMRRRYDDKV